MNALGSSSRAYSAREPSWLLVKSSRGGKTGTGSRMTSRAKSVERLSRNRRWTLSSTSSPISVRNRRNGSASPSLISTNTVSAFCSMPSPSREPSAAAWCGALSGTRHADRVDVHLGLGPDYRAPISGGKSCGKPRRCSPDSASPASDWRRSHSLHRVARPGRPPSVAGERRSSPVASSHTSAFLRARRRWNRRVSPVRSPSGRRRRCSRRQSPST